MNNRFVILGGLNTPKRSLEPMAQNLEANGVDDIATASLAWALGNPTKLKSLVRDATVLGHSAAPISLLREMKPGRFVSIASPEPRSVSELVAGAVHLTVNNHKHGRHALNFQKTTEALLRPDVPIRNLRRISTFSTAAIGRAIQNSGIPFDAVTMTGDEFFPQDVTTRAYTKTFGCGYAIELDGNHDEVLVNTDVMDRVFEVATQ